VLRRDCGSGWSAQLRNDRARSHITRIGVGLRVHVYTHSLERHTASEENQQEGKRLRGSGGSHVRRNRLRRKSERRENEKPMQAIRDCTQTNSSRVKLFVLPRSTRSHSFPHSHTYTHIHTHTHTVFAPPQPVVDIVACARSESVMSHSLCPSMVRTRRGRFVSERVEACANASAPDRSVGEAVADPSRPRLIPHTDPSSRPRQ
jgi:hypothetical protein